jgi:hypothetical protein
VKFLKIYRAIAGIMKYNAKLIALNNKLLY